MFTFMHMTADKASLVISLNACTHRQKILILPNSLVYASYYISLCHLNQDHL